jgi:CubicO group peptidase (beta-lactamase class C family)
MTRYIVAIAGLLAFFLLGALSPARADAVDDYVLAQLHRNRIPGASVLVLRNGRVERSKGYGLADLALSVPATENTVYRIGSLTKQFTATAVMMLVEQGKLAVDDRIEAHLPDLPPAWAAVTVRQLLSHTSGIPDYTEREDMAAFRLTPHTPAQIVGQVAAAPPQFSPGAQYRYSNTNYVLLGMLVEKLSGQTLAEYLADHVFTPLGMTHTVRAEARQVGARGTTRADYQQVNPPAMDFSNAYGAGDLVSTVGDLAKWEVALAGERLLKRATLEQMWTSAVLNDGKPAGYGFGWQVGALSGQKMISHGGNVAGFSSAIVRIPGAGLSVILLTNFDLVNAGAIARGIAGQVDRSLQPAVTPPPADTDPAQTSRHEAIFRGMMTGTMDESAFSPALVKDLGPRIGSNKEAREKSFADFGPRQSFTLSSRRVTEAGTELQYRALFEFQSLTVFITLDGAGKISNWGVRGGA